MDEIKALAEKYLGAEISQELFELELPAAMRKLEWIISREGDADGERTKPYYIAQLVAEIIRSDVMTAYCFKCYEDKKRAARKTDNPVNQPHYSTKRTVLSRETVNFSY